MRSTPKTFPDRFLGVYCCGHVFRGERPVELVGRQDGDWQFVCGNIDHSDQSEPYHVSVGILLDADPSLNEVADLPNEWEAERQGKGNPWIRTRCGTRDA